MRINGSPFQPSLNITFSGKKVPITVRELQRGLKATIQPGNPHQRLILPNGQAMNIPNKTGDIPMGYITTAAELLGETRKSLLELLKNKKALKQRVAQWQQEAKRPAAIKKRYSVNRFC